MVEFKKGEKLKAADLQELANGLQQLEAEMPKMVEGRQRTVARSPLAYYNCPPGYVPSISYSGAMLHCAGVVCAVRYNSGAGYGRIAGGVVELPPPAARVPGMGMMAYSAGEDGVIPMPAMVLQVADVNKKAIDLANLALGEPESEWQAATLARCTLPDGTPLVLKGYTTNEGACLHFVLQCGDDYGYSG